MALVVIGVGSLAVSVVALRTSRRASRDSLDLQKRSLALERIRDAEEGRRNEPQLTFYAVDATRVAIDAPSRFEATRVYVANAGRSDATEIELDIEVFVGGRPSTFQPRPLRIAMLANGGGTEADSALVAELPFILKFSPGFTYIAMTAAWRVLGERRVSFDEITTYSTIA